MVYGLGFKCVCDPSQVSAIDIDGLDIGQFAIILMMGASTAFATPIGYQTNLMVYGLGGYRFTDFTRLGFPLTVSCALVTAGLLSV